MFFLETSRYQILYGMQMMRREADLRGWKVIIYMMSAEEFGRISLYQNISICTYQQRPHGQLNEIDTMTSIALLVKDIALHSLYLYRIT